MTVSRILLRLKPYRFYGHERLITASCRDSTMTITIVAPQLCTIIGMQTNQ